MWRPNRPRAARARELASVGGFLVLAIAHTYPLAIQLATHLPYSLHDPGEVLTRLEWERYSLLHDPTRFFDGFIFYGLPGAQFFTNLVLGGLPVYFPVAQVTGNPVLALNLAHLLGLAATGWLAYRAAFEVLQDRPAALGAGIVWTFALPQLTLYPGLEWTMAWGVPLMVWAVLSFLRRPAAWKLAAATAGLWLALATHIYSAFIGAPLALLLLATAALWGVLPWRWLARHAPRAAVAVGLATLPFLPVIQGYFEVPRKWSETRTIWHTRWYAAEPLDYLAPLPGSVWHFGWLAEQGRRSQETHERVALFPGLAAPALAGLGLVWSARARARLGPCGQAAAAAAALAVLGGFVLSLGPELIWQDRPTGIRLPFAWLHEVFPPIRALRAVSRFSYLMVLGLALLAGLGVVAIRSAARCTVGARRWPAWAAAAAVLALALEPLHAPLETYALDILAPTSPVNAFLKRLDPAPMIFLPVEAPMDPWPESRRMYWALTSGPFRIVNGSSGIYPASYWDLQRLADGASPQDVPVALRVFRSSGIRYVVLEQAIMDQRMRGWWACALADPAQARSLFAHDGTIVADLGPRPAGIQVGLDALHGALRNGRVPAGSGTTLLIDVAAKDPSRIWLQEPEPAAPFRTVRLTWRPLASGQDGAPAAGRRQALLRRLSFGLLGLPPTDRPFVVERRVVLPTFLAEGASRLLAVHSFTPERPGPYEVTAEIDGRHWTAWQVQAGAGQPPLKVAEAPGGLAARLWPVAVRQDVFAGEPVTIDILAENVGRTLWDGQIRLGYRWSRITSDGRVEALPDLGGRVFLGEDTAPGGTYRFSGQIATPAAPGQYRLLISMVAEKIIWFDEMTPPGVSPLEYVVTVRAPDQPAECTGQ